MAELFRNYIYYTFDSLTKYDFMAIGWILFLSLLLFVLAALIKRKAISYTLLAFGLISIFIGLPAVKYIMDGYLRASKVHVLDKKLLRYSKSLVVKGTVENRSRLDFRRCDLALLIYRKYDNPLKQTAAFLKPIAVRIKHIDTPIKKDETKHFQIIVDHFTTRDFNLNVLSRCYP